MWIHCQCGHSWRSRAKGQTDCPKCPERFRFAPIYREAVARREEAREARKTARSPRRRPPRTTRAPMSTRAPQGAMAVGTDTELEGEVGDRQDELVPNLYAMVNPTGRHGGARPGLWAPLLPTSALTSWLNAPCRPQRCIAAPAAMGTALPRRRQLGRSTSTPLPFAGCMVDPHSSSRSGVSAGISGGTGSWTSTGSTVPSTDAPESKSLATSRLSRRRVQIDTGGAGGVRTTQ